MSEIVIAGHSIPFTVTRSDKAKRIRLAMNMSEFRVVAPQRATQSQIIQALEEKKGWILKHHEAFRLKSRQMHHIVRFQSGAKLPYWGRLARLHTQASDVKTPEITYRHGFHISHPSYSDPHQHDFEIEQAIHRFLKDKFADQVEVFVREYSDKLGLSPTVVRIRQMRTRWGSCSSSGCISLDWRLVYAPKRVASYVVAHELAHLKVMNHGPRFWNTLSMIFGEYDDAHQWLKKNDHLLGYVKLPIAGVQHVTG